MTIVIFSSRCETFPPCVRQKRLNWCMFGCSRNNAGSFIFFSKLFASCWVQLSHTTSAYSKRGLIIDTRVLNDRVRSSPVRMLISHKCLLEFTLLIRFWFMLSGGWKGLLCLRDSIIDSDFAGLNDASNLLPRHFLWQYRRLVRQQHLWDYLQ